MNEKLIIKNFLAIEHAEVDIKRFNVIIGPQAKGKSVIAKVLYFFRTAMEFYLVSFDKFYDEQAIIDELINKFREWFPYYTWKEKRFNLNYIIGSHMLSLSNEIDSLNNHVLVMSFPDKFTTIRDTILDEKKSDSLLMETSLSSALKKSYLSVEFARELRLPSMETTYIPASRSFLSFLQNNMFSFIRGKNKVDPFLIEFGSIYETARREYESLGTVLDLFLELDVGTIDKIKKIIEEIVQGRYVFEDRKDWIISSNNIQKTELSYSSSGQQEAIPMLIVLAYFMYIKDGQNYHNLCLLEEPEAHLFPQSQNQVISMLSLLYDELKTNFFITTHSPYILSAINNLILAGDTINAGKMTREEFEKINGPSAPINLDDVAAYTIVDGKTESIVDYDYRLIGGDILDSVSDHFSNVMNELLKRDM